MKKNPFSKTKGQSLVEFALSLLMILFILVGAVEVSLALFEYVTMRDAAQEGALYGSVNPTDVAGIQYRVISAASDVLTLQASNITVSWSDSSKKCEGLTGGVPHSLTVTIARQHQMVMPIAGAFIGNNQRINMSANVTDTILSPTCP
jgi:Flp pilus assembly protein TadG